MLSPVHREECQDILESGEGEEHGGHGGAGNCELHGSPGLTLYSNGGDWGRVGKEAERPTGCPICTWAPLEPHF